MAKQTNLDNAKWFKNNFKSKIENIIQGTPFSVDMLTAMAMQETSYIWGPLRDKMSVEEILKVCVGDTLDSPNRGAFPKNKAELLTHPKGAQMFTIAREALEAVGKHNETFGKLAKQKPNKFCHGFGILQCDLQHFKKAMPQFFLEKRWHDFDQCLTIAVDELKAALIRAYDKNKKTLTDKERVFVAIAYNKGSVNTNGTFKQGFQSGDGKFYGENIAEFMEIAKQAP